jgi:hypothetical protein
MPGNSGEMTRSLAGPAKPLADVAQAIAPLQVRRMGPAFGLEPLPFLVEDVAFRIHADP